MCVYIHIYTLFKLERNTRDNNCNNSNTSLPSFCAFFFRVIYNIHTVSNTQTTQTQKKLLEIFLRERKEKKNGSIVEYRMMINIISNSKKKNYERNTAG